ncbi:MAG: methyl-accepting chemotaxis protein [Oligoflexia bacterium]|nr:methyl-accepting chemotaxis protein [Oligoflexia bacterium]
MKQLTLKRRIAIALLPGGLVIAGALAALWLTISGSSKALMTLSNAMHLDSLAQQAQYQILTMSDAIKAYLLNPYNMALLERKMAADQELETVIGSLKAATTDSDLQSKITELDKINKEELAPRSQKLVDMIKADQIERAQRFFEFDYGVIEKKYNDAIAQMRAEISKIPAATQARIEANNTRVRNITLFGALVGIIGVSIYLLRTLTKLTGQIGHVLNEVKKEAEIVTGASGEIRNASDRLQEATHEQTSAVQETTSAITEMSATLAKNAESAKSSVEMGSCSHSAATKGKLAVVDVIEAIGRMSDSNAKVMQQVEESNRRIGEISQLIQEIGSKTKVINDIVFQTKLLSFNASVEAARAGEHGKGFAVVAEEVGKLAQMSGNAAKEISEMLSQSILKVEGIVTETRSKVTGLIEEGKITVKRGTEVATQCEAALNEIVQNVDQVNIILREISSATVEQTKGMGEISMAMSRLDETAHGNSATSAQVTHSADQLATQAQTLHRLIAMLDQVVNGAKNPIGTAGQAAEDEQRGSEDDLNQRAA